VATWNNYFLPLVVLSDPTHYPVVAGFARPGT
jgi:ABC-type glycerol-3-phosphate transport system permease component